MLEAAHGNVEATLEVNRRGCSDAELSRNEGTDKNVEAGEERTKMWGHESEDAKARNVTRRELNASQITAGRGQN